MFQSPPTRAKMIHFWVTAENLPSPVWSAGNIPHMRIKSNCPVWVGIFGPYQSAVHLLFQQKGENRPRSAMSATKNMASFLRLAWHGLGWVFKRRKQQGQTTLVGNKWHIHSIVWATLWTHVNTRFPPRPRPVINKGHVPPGKAAVAIHVQAVKQGLEASRRVARARGIRKTQVIYHLVI